MKYFYHFDNLTTASANFRATLISLFQIFVQYWNDPQYLINRLYPAAVVTSCHQRGTGTYLCQRWNPLVSCCKSIEWDIVYQGLIFWKCKQHLCWYTHFCINYVLEKFYSYHLHLDTFIGCHMIIALFNSIGHGWAMESLLSLSS